MPGGEFLTFWTMLLQLPDYEVAHVNEDTQAQRLSLTVIPKHPLGVCPLCGQVSDDVKQRRTRERIHDLPIGCNAVELKVRQNQFSCSRCLKCFTPPISFLAEGAHATERFLARAAQLIRQSDVLNAARFLSVPEKTLSDWYYAYVERQQQPRAMTLRTPIRHMGIDELSLKKNTDSSSQ